MWSKGAVVIVKHGDPEWANEMEKSIKDIQSLPISDRMDLQAVQNEIYKKYYTQYWQKKINKAQRKYGRIHAPSKPVRIAIGAWGFVVCRAKIFIDKYLVY